jgi:hypothetical protein
MKHRDHFGDDDDDVLRPGSPSLSSSSTKISRPTQLFPSINGSSQQDSNLEQVNGTGTEEGLQKLGFDFSLVFFEQAPTAETARTAQLKNGHSDWLTQLTGNGRRRARRAWCQARC